MRGNKVKHLSREELVATLSTLGWHLVGGEGVAAWNFQKLSLEIIHVKIVGKKNSYMPIVFSTGSSRTRMVNLRFDFTVTSPNPYTVELNRVYPHTVRRRKSEGGGEHQVDLLGTWFTFVNEPMRLVAKAKAEKEAAEWAAERKIALDKIAKRKS